MKHPTTLILAGILMLAATACSPVLEATRPAPTDLSRFTPGQTRNSVVAVLGPPLGQITQGGDPCDQYRLYTGAPNALAKGSIAAGEAVADVFTLGLTEIIFTPVEVATRNKQHTVTICYDESGHLTTITDGGTL